MKTEKNERMWQPHPEQHLFDIQQVLSFKHLFQYLHYLEKQELDKTKCISPELNSTISNTS